jgi:ATP-dependent Clp protease adaptor protein ClpS
MTIFEKEHMGKAVTKSRPVPKFDIKEPPMYRVIYINDEVTTMEFVVESLTNVFNYSPEDAHELTAKIHEQGSAIVAVLPYEMAEQKGIEGTNLARQHGYPLIIKVESE